MTTFQHGMAVPKLWKIFLSCSRGHGCVRGYEVVVPILYLGSLPDLAFFVEFLSCVLVEDCVWVLGFFCGLKEKFRGEVRCGFLGF